MGKFIIRDPVVTVDGVDLSDHISSCSIPQESEDKDVTGFGAQAREHAAGIPDASMTFSFWQDFDAGSVDAILQPIYDDPDTPVEIVVKPHDAAVSATNPSRTMQAILLNYNPLQGEVGEPSATEVTFQNADQSGVVRATS